MTRQIKGMFFVVGLAAIAAASACGGEKPQAAGVNATGTPAATPGAIVAGAVQLAPENVATAEVATITSGPTVSGQLTPAREASVRTQVGGSIVMLTLDRGQTVKEGDVIAKISSRDLDDAFESSSAAVRSADTTLATAKSEMQRTEALVKGGALATRDLEQARSMVSNAEAQVAAAKARQKAVWQQLDDTTVRAPISGIVNQRQANIGDVVTSGAPILTIIDPSSLRLEALVPSDQIARLRPGARVRFNVRGYDKQVFLGSIDRLSPIADAVTRQVSIFVTLPNSDRKLIAGLYAEGRVEAETRSGIVIPQAALDESGPVTTVTRVRDGKAERIIVEVGLRQNDTEKVEITKGLTAGDIVIVGSAKGVANGTPVHVVGRN